MQSETSLHAFRDILAEQLAEIASHEALDLNNNENAGYAFSLWVAKLFFLWDGALDDDQFDVVQRGGGDLGIDVVLEDEANKTLFLIQTKNHGTGRRAKPLDVDPARAFLERHNDLMTEAAVTKGNNKARELLTSYPERIREGWKVRSYFVTTGRDDAGMMAEYERRNEAMSSGDVDVEFRLLDTNSLRDMYNEIQSRDASIPDEVEIDIPQEYFFENATATPPFIVGLLKGNSLRNEYKKKGRKESLFAWNIRNYLGDRGINKEIRATATDDPSHFFYFNNGITAVCKDYELIGNKLKIWKFQIINGAQTVASIARAPARDSLLVMFRLIKTGKVDTQAGLNHQIVQANNTQNAIRMSDFRANDPIQRWLEQQFAGTKASETVGKVTYQPKRTGQRGAGRVVKFEELAKMRYAFLYEPVLVHSSPKLLWTSRTDQGRYEDAFGIDGELHPTWSKQKFEDTLVGLAFYDAITHKARLERLRDEKISFFHRLRFHALSLVGTYWKEHTDHVSSHTILASKEKFDAIFKPLWEGIRDILFMIHRQYVRSDDSPMTLFAFVRNDRVWAAMLETFRFKFQL